MASTTTTRRGRSIRTAGGRGAILAAVPALILASALPAAATPAGGEQDPEVTLCHATGSATNPYTQITVAASAAYNGHYRQHQDVGQGDIIPPFTYQGETYSQRWDAAGQATFHNGCTEPGTPEDPAGPGDHHEGEPKDPGHPGDPHHPADPGNPGDEPKVTLCHATGSTTNPYVQITVAAAGAYDGHYRQHQDLGQGDIIPPFTYQRQTYSLNWDSAGQATFAGGCQAPATPADSGDSGTPGDAGNSGNPSNPGNPGGQGTPAGGGQAVGAAPQAVTAPKTATGAEGVGPIPGAADAGQGPTDGWQLPAGLTLATLGAVAGGTALYRRKLLGG
jgi:hypothetical protein